MNKPKPSPSGGSALERCRPLVASAGNSGARLRERWRPLRSSGPRTAENGFSRRFWSSSLEDEAEPAARRILRENALERYG
jgi:hypothetical protein